MILEVSAFIEVIPALDLSFRTLPTGAISGETISPPVEVEVTEDGILSPDAVEVTLRLAEGTGELRGEVTTISVGGIATFDEIDILGHGEFRLEASSPLASSALSEPFSVHAFPPSDAVERALAQLVEQFKRKPRIVAMVEAFVGQVADLEDALEELRTGRSLDQAQGAQLDGLGTIIGLPRGGMDDEQYRARLRVQIRVLRGQGTPEDILGAVSLATGGARLRLHESQPAELRLVVEDGIAPEVARIVAYLVRTMKPAGVRAWLESGSEPSAASFCFAGGDGLGFGEGALRGVQHG